MSDKRNYRIRYRVEEWNKPIVGPVKSIAPGLSVASDYGYADKLLVASILVLKNGSHSVALFDSESRCGKPSKELLTMIRQQIDHHLEHHLDE